MNEAVFNLLMAVVTAAVTALSAFVAAFVKKKGEEAASVSPCLPFRRPTSMN